MVVPPLTRTLPAALLVTAAFGLAVGCKDKKPEPAPDAPAEKSAAAKDADKPAAAPPSGGVPADSLKLPALPEMPIPEDNPQSDAKVALGHQLFFDKRMSVDGSVSCYSCHQNENGNGGATPLAVGAKGTQLTRHSPVIWNVGYLPKHYWDGRADSLEAQAKGAWAGGNMGYGKENIDGRAKELAAMPEYKAQFEAAFPGEAVTADTVAKAISAYERTLICGDTAYDKYVAGDKEALTSEQKDGLSLFMGKAMCAACHAPPHFSTAYLGEGAFFNIGIGTQDAEGKPLAKADIDPGRQKITENAADFAAFKPPSLRNVTKSAPYFHDGHVATLKEAVELMASGGYENDNRTPLMSDKKLTSTEIDQLLAFLSALECGGKLEEPTAAK